MSVEKPVFAIITCSDTRGPECDTAGDALESLIEEQGWACRTHMIVKDDRAGIAAAIKRCTDDLKVDIVLTCGGSGLSPRDNTPEATRDVISREIPAIPQAMLHYSLGLTPRAMLTRGVAGIRGKSLILNLPGNEGGAKQNLSAVLGVLEHALQMISKDE